MDDPDPFGPQADINLIGQSMQTAGAEILKLQILPAITGGERILVEIQQMRREMREQNTRLEERITAVDQHLQTLTTKMTTRYSLLLYFLILPY